jgi:chromate reductase
MICRIIEFTIKYPYLLFQFKVIQAMKKILAFAGSNSSTSINFKLVKYACSLVPDKEINLLNMTNYPFPMYSEDLEKKSGFSNSLGELHSDIQNSDGLLISVNEHNGNLSAYFKNVIDWLSRFNRDFIKGQKIFLMSASPGKRGGIGAKESAAQLFTRMGAEVVTTFSLPSFKDNFNLEEGRISNEELDEILKKELQTFLDRVSQ